MKEKTFRKKLSQIQEKNKSKIYKNRLKEEKRLTKKSIETSKLFAFYLFIILNAIVVYAMVVMYKFKDLSYLGVLITDIAAQVLTYGIYCLKAYNSKRQEEQVKLKKEMYLDTQSKDVEDIYFNNDKNEEG